MIRVATARDPSQAAPLTGGYIGAAEAFAGLSVDVQVQVLSPTDAVAPFADESLAPA